MTLLRGAMASQPEMKTNWLPVIPVQPFEKHFLEWE